MTFLGRHEMHVNLLSFRRIETGSTAVSHTAVGQVSALKRQATESFKGELLQEMKVTALSWITTEFVQPCWGQVLHGTCSGWDWELLQDSRKFSRKLLPMICLLHLGLHLQHLVDALMQRTYSFILFLYNWAAEGCSVSCRCLSWSPRQLHSYWRQSNLSGGEKLRTGCKSGSAFLLRMHTSRSTKTTGGNRIQNLTGVTRPTNRKT